MSGSLRVTPDLALSSYQKAATSAVAAAADGDSAANGFGATLQRALGNAISTGEYADTAATTAVTSGGDLTSVVTAVSKAQLALQEVVAIRDKVVSAYQDIMRMTI